MAGPFNLAIRFVLELVAVIAAAVAGANLGSPPLGIPGAIVATVLFVGVWGLFIAPRARYPQPPTLRLMVGSVLMELTAVGLIAAGFTTAGAILGVAILANAVVLAAFGADVDGIRPG
jgi:hypothetical protein